MKQNWERQKKHGQKKPNGSNLVKMRYQIQFFWSLEFEQKTDIGEINSSGSDNEEEGAKAVVWRHSAADSVEKVSLQISQNSQENTCARVSFSIKLQVFCKISRNTFFYRTPPVAASIGAEYKVKRISNWVAQVQYKSSHWQMLFEIVVRPPNLLKRDYNTGGFLSNLRNF